MNQEQLKFHSNEREIDQRVETINSVAEKMHEIKSIAAGLQSMVYLINVWYPTKEQFWTE